VYTLPRHEKKAARELELQGLEHWLPLHKVRKQWSDRRKWVEEPLFKSYLFVLVTPKTYFAVLNTYGIVRYIYHEGQPAEVRPDQMKMLRRLLDSTYELEVTDLQLSPGQKIRVEQGPLMGQIGTLVQQNSNQSVRVDLDILQRSVLVTIPLKFIRPLDQG
jgi:transcription antitermination factor NusG